MIVCKKKNEGNWYYEQQNLGFNYRITDMQCALGLSQLQRLDFYVQKRTILAERYNSLLGNLPLICPFQVPYSSSAYHLYPVKVNREKTNKTRRELFDYLRSHHIGVQVHYIPIHYQPYYRNLGFKKGILPHTEAYYEAVLSLPLFPKMSEKQQDKIIQHLKDFFS